MIHRSVRREDIAQATRINLFYSSVDPQMFAGQPFEEPSVKGVTMLKSGAEVPYVIGVIDGEDPMGGIGAMMQQVAKQSAGAKPGGSPLSGMASLFTSGHTYYRGTLKRVEAAGIEEVILYFNVGAKPNSLVQEQMHKFMAEIAPHFAGKHRERGA